MRHLWSIWLSYRLSKAARLLSNAFGNVRIDADADDNIIGLAFGTYAEEDSKAEDKRGAA